MFLPNSNACAFLLLRASANIAQYDVEQFFINEIFSYSHVIPAEKILEPLRTRQFPSQNFSEYQFAISEIPGLRRDGKYSSWFRFYLSTLYVHCESMENNQGDDIEYYCAIVKDIVANDRIEVAKIFAQYLEWLYENANWSIVGRDYWLLLSWLLLKRITDGKCHFPDIYRLLLSEERRAELKKRLHFGDLNVSDWLALERDISDRYGLAQNDFQRVIAG